MKFLCEAAANQGNSVVIYIILAVMVVAMLILPYFSNKKRNQQYMDMISSIKVGDLVKTAGGLIGKVTKITDKGEIKTIILETGSKSEKSYMEFDISSVYCVLKSTKVEKEEAVEEKTSENEEVAAEEPPVQEAEVKEEPKKEENPKKKASSSKTKKSTK